ncbi:hypothetical protein CYME_CMD187C [Cyanidioschyzon merolae strain 10D]|jgi:hypothetical protein|uniref:Uncharacterized protein n=1 Tax=Cyanidioschyzon merolae (strain NIES-3377 / 10D) TaxID=280699 RepID=M1V4C0_CYAM1|nr:hypothetical protein CYME_CMD187C [Cyanidioschyzon merolae strain 10D]BAM79240.1 hypothetical protein CYME_CMD187C [Cyanidioschyzon merolae strain 10D]|eukprot:XP_005535526.1 hypothetical protein CYME_CMD187C [Cyanidioschyzon merolae strain 10D]
MHPQRVQSVPERDEEQYELRKSVKQGLVQLERHHGGFSQGARAHERKEREVHKGGHGRGGAPGSLDEEISRVLKKSGGKAEEALRIAQEDEEPYAEGEAEDDAEDAHAAEATGTEPLENGSLDASAPSSATPGESVP